jgi:beta-xylosidase
VGGTAAGGSATGGKSVGGSPAGGTATGGTATGGKATGGTTGGTTTGGTATGGKATGGTTTGGKAAGGTATGGTSGTGGSSCTPPAAGSKGTNPLFTDQYTADPAALVHNCTFYINCGHDQGSTGFVMREWFILSSTNMVTWTKQVGMTLSTFSWANANAWAGQMVTKNGKFYWYVPVQESSTGAMAIGVAVANSPTGPFTDAIGKPLVNDAFEMSNMGFATAGDTPYTIDPSVFVDDDGQAYLHYGGFWRLVEARLNADMISINGKMQESTPQNYFESPYLIKRNTTYYEIYSAGSANPTTIDYATSSSPMGPWTRRGQVLPTMAGVSGQDAPTNHAGVAQFAGQWYIVYHLSNGPNGGGTYKREVAIDKLNFNSDGTIQPVTPSSGLSF